MIAYTIDVTRRLILVQMSGPNTLAELLRHFSALSADQKFDPTFNALFFITEDARLEMTFLGNLLKTLLEQWEQRRKGVKWAIVSPSRSQLGLAESLTENIRLKFVQMRFFNDEESAMNWLNSGGTS